MEWSDFSNFGKGSSSKDHFCEIILKSGHWSTMRCHLKVFLCLALVAILFSGAEWSYFSNFGRWSPKEHFCDIILKSGNWSRRCHLKVYQFLARVGILLCGAKRV